ncbi:MAG: Spy/CpxP family protein refolding chaperone [Pigmentiphaga sp.]|nr:Spy/CpxP family protein refolding chaperone [Pigmentiphaga sp.]
MKTFRLAAIALASGLALGGTAAWAQPAAPAAAAEAPAAAQGKAADEARGHSPRRAAAHRAESRHDGKRWAHGDRGPRHAWRALDLTDEQKDKMFSLRHAAAPELRKLMKEAGGYERELQDMVRGGKFDESAARELAKGSSDARAKLLVLRAKLQADTMALFTPEQRAKAERLHARAGQHHPGGRQGPGGAGDAPRPMR